MSEKYKVGIISTGGIEDYGHSPEISQLESVELFAVLSRSKEKADSF